MSAKTTEDVVRSLGLDPADPLDVLAQTILELGVRGVRYRGDVDRDALGRSVVRFKEAFRAAVAAGRPTHE